MRLTSIHSTASEEILSFSFYRLNSFLIVLALAWGGAIASAQSPQPAPGAQAPATTPAPQAAPAPNQSAPPAAPAASSFVSAPAQTAPAATGTLHGHIMDPTGALIPGAQVKVLTAAGKNAGSVAADAVGGYQVGKLPGGSYVIEATFEGFAPFVSQPIQLSPGQTKNVDIKMAIEAAQQQVVVTDEGGQAVSTDAENNANSTVLKGSDLDALSDDPDELSNELSALAGPSAGPNGGQIYIDGFTGGQLPPKSAIREIRINRNPFSAEFDRIGFGRIEILTKPGTDTLHGRFFGQGNDNVFNTGNPFTAELPSYYSFQYNASVSGSLSKWASFFLSVEQRDTQTDNVYSILGGPVYNAASNTWSVSSGSVAGILFSPANFLAPHRPAVGTEEHAYPALPVLPQQPERLARPDLASVNLQQLRLHRSRRSTGRYAGHQQPDGERDALRVPPLQFLVHASEHRAQL
jgi:hypothetical protein